jgi:hypothetical protein
MRLIPSFLMLFVVISMSGCKQQHTVAGDYRLEQWEDGKTYYLHKRGHDDSSEGGSVIGGIVLRLGWSSRYILAERQSIYRGDADGWMIIDVQSGVMTGPFTEAVLRTHLEAQGIQTFEVNEAWKKL